MFITSCTTTSEFTYKICNCYYTKKLEVKYNDVFIPAHDGLTKKEGELPHFHKYPLKSLKNNFEYLYCGIDTSLIEYLNSDSTMRVITSFTCVDEWNY